MGGSPARARALGRPRMTLFIHRADRAHVRRSGAGRIGVASSSGDCSGWPGQARSRHVNAAWARSRSTHRTCSPSRSRRPCADGMGSERAFREGREVPFDAMASATPGPQALFARSAVGRSFARCHPVGADDDGVECGAPFGNRLQLGESAAMELVVGDHELLGSEPGVEQPVYPHCRRWGSRSST